MGVPSHQRLASVSRKTAKCRWGVSFGALPDDADVAEDLALPDLVALRSGRRRSVEVGVVVAVLLGRVELIDGDAAGLAVEQPGDRAVLDRLDRACSAGPGCRSPRAPARRARRRTTGPARRARCLRPGRPGRRPFQRLGRPAAAITGSGDAGGPASRPAVAGSSRRRSGRRPGRLDHALARIVDAGHPALDRRARLADGCAWLAVAAPITLPNCQTIAATTKAPREEAAARAGGEGRGWCARVRRAWRCRCHGYSVKTTRVPGLTMPASFSASQLVRRTQPCDSVRPIVDGSGVPWMP